MLKQKNKIQILNNARKGIKLLSLDVCLQKFLTTLPISLDGYELVINQSVKHNNQKPIFLRFERIDGCNTGFGGEHISFLIGSAFESPKLLSFAAMTNKYCESKKHILNQEEAYKIALNFLNNYVEDFSLDNAPIFSDLKLTQGHQSSSNKLSDNIELHWIAQHDNEKIKLFGEEKFVSGMKVKMRQTQTIDQWSWVIVNGMGNICVFERNISWDMNIHKRKTEKWLHDYEVSLPTDSIDMIMNKEKYMALRNG